MPARQETCHRSGGVLASVEMSIRRIAIVCVVVLAACRRGPSGPDDNYEQASRLYQRLYASQLDDAYGDPQMDQVVALLNKVDPNSVDAPAAQTMLHAITNGRAELAKQRAAREKMAAAAAASANAAMAAPSIDPAAYLAASAPDAGPPQDPFGAGALVSDINAQTGGCLTDYEPFNENGTGVTGTIYRVVASDSCTGKLPGFVGQAVLVVNGRIYRRIPDPNPPKPPQPATPPDAGPAPKAAPAAQKQAPADAGEPEYRMVVPGMPEPGATPPPAQQQQ